MARTWARHPDTGTIIDPPNLSDYERKLEDAKSAADEDLIEQITQDYEAERTRIVEDIESRASDDAPNKAWSRERLDAYAAGRGVGDPSSLPNKQAVIDAIGERDEA